MRLACSFRSDLTLDQIRARLNELGPWKWIERDNDNWGPYTSAVFNRAAARAIVKILHEGEGYAVIVHYSWDDPRAPDDFEAARRILFENLLPAIGARDLAETEDYD